MTRVAEFVAVLVAVLAAIALGVAAIVLGEADDSPGLQGIGALVVIGAVVAALRWRGPRSGSPRPTSPTALRWARGPHRPAGHAPPLPPGQVPDPPR